MPVPPAGRPTVVVAPFEHDPTGAVTDAVRRAIERVDCYTVRPPGLLETIYWKTGLGAKAVAPEAAEALAREKLDAEFVLAGRVTLLSARSDKDEAALEGVLVPVAPPGMGKGSAGEDSGRGDAAQGSGGETGRGIRLVAEAVHDHTPRARPTAIETYAWPARLVAWLAAALLLPLVAAPLVCRGLEKESNAINLALLVGLTAVAGLTAYAMLGFRLATGWAAALLVLGTALALIYNWAVLAKLEELRT